MPIDTRNDLNVEDFDELIAKLEATTFHTYSKDNRRGVPKHQALCLGLCRGRTSKVIGMSFLSDKYPELTAYIFSLFDKLFYFKFTSIQINKNLVSPPHMDSHNQNLSLIFSIGNYEGGNLFFEEEEYDTRYKAHVLMGVN